MALITWISRSTGIKTLRRNSFALRFFLLFPWLIRLTGFALRTPVLVSALLVTNISFLVGVVYFHRFARKHLDERGARNAVVVLSYFPTAYLFHVPYSESLFLCLSVLLFYHADRGNWKWAGIFGAMATASRVTGLAILPALAYEYWSKKKKVGLGD